MHSKCFRKHVCPFFTGTRKRNIGMTSFLALDDENPLPEEPRPLADSIFSIAPQMCNTAPPSSQAPVIPNTSQLPSMASPLPHPQPLPQASLAPFQLTTSVSFTSASPPGPITSFNPQLAIPIPSLPTFGQISASANPPAPRGKRSKPNPGPEAVQLEFLKKELTIAQTKIAALENDVKRKEETCKLQEERIISLVHPAVSNLFNQYIPQPQPHSPSDTCQSTLLCLNTKLH